MINQTIINHAHNTGENVSSKSAAISPINNWSLLNNGLLGALYIVLLVLVFIGNLLVIVAVATTKRLRRTPHCFIASLALADLLMVTGPIPLAGLLTFYGYWPLDGKEWCVFWVGSCTLLCTASVYNLAAISIDRLISCMQPIRYRLLFQKKRVVLLLSITWLVSLFLVLIPFMTGTNSVSGKGRCHGRLDLHLRIFNAVIGSLLPFSVTACANLCILCVLRSRYRMRKWRRQIEVNVVSMIDRRIEVRGERVGRLPLFVSGTTRTAPDPKQSISTGTSEIHYSNSLRPIIWRNNAKFFTKLNPFALINLIRVILLPRDIISDSRTNSLARHVEPSWIIVLTNILADTIIPMVNRYVILVLFVNFSCNSVSTVYRGRRVSATRTSQSEVSKHKQTDRDKFARDFDIRPREDSQTCETQPIATPEIRLSSGFPVTVKDQNITVSGFPSRSERRTYWMILIVILCFTICWAPYMLCYYTEAILGVHVSTAIHGILFWIALANSACNPVIYGLLDKRYRTAFRLIVQACRVPRLFYIFV